MNRHEFLKTMAAATASILMPQWSWSDQPGDLKTYTFKTVGGCELNLDAYGSDPKVRKPVMVTIHGGALIMGSRKGRPPKWMNPQDEYMVISIDYRLAPETKWPGIIEDVQDAFRWIHKHGPRLLNIDTERLIVNGGSAGGYLTLMTGFCVKPRPKGLISVSGFGDMIADWLTHPSGFAVKQPPVSKEEAYASVGTACLTEPPRNNQRGKFFVYCRQNGAWPREITGHDPLTEPKWFRRYSPARNVTAQYPPAVLIHGTADTDVLYDAAVKMDAALAQGKVPHRLVTIPGGGHTFGGSTPQEIARIYAEALAFVKEYLT
jgi:acetyl esterase/lipase